MALIRSEKKLDWAEPNTYVAPTRRPLAFELIAALLGLLMRTLIEY
jgi:hypothetical protein